MDTGEYQKQPENELNLTEESAKFINDIEEIRKTLVDSVDNTPFNLERISLGYVRNLLINVEASIIQPGGINGITKEGNVYGVDTKLDDLTLSYGKDDDRSYIDIDRTLVRDFEEAQLYKLRIFHGTSEEANQRSLHVILITSHPLAPNYKYVPAECKIQWNQRFNRNSITGKSIQNFKILDASTDKS